MSDRFVSGGTISSSGEVTKDVESSQPATVKNAEWEVVQKELDAERQRREDARRKLASGEQEKSLYEVLEANKGAYCPAHKSGLFKSRRGVELTLCSGEASGFRRTEQDTESVPGIR